MGLAEEVFCTAWLVAFEDPIVRVRAQVFSESGWAVETLVAVWVWAGVIFAVGGRA